MRSARSIFPGVNFAIPPDVLGDNFVPVLGLESWFLPHQGSMTSNAGSSAINRCVSRLTVTSERMRSTT